MDQQKPKGYNSLASGGMPRVFWLIVGLATVLAIAIVLFSVYRGYRQGQAQNLAQERQEIAILLQKAEDLKAEGDAQAALGEYQKVLLLDAENEAAIIGIGQLLEPVQSPVTPTAPTPTTPTAAPTPLNPLEVVWADAQALYNAGRWEEAISQLGQVQAADPNFEAERVEEMLYTAYVSLGTEKSNAGSLEESVRLFDQALDLRPDEVEIRTIRDVTAQYVDALTYWFADWPKVIELLSELYQRSPGYRDVRQRLQRAHLEYGDSLSRQGDWCAAAGEYADAIEVQNGPGLEQKQTEFETLCRSNAQEASSEDEQNSAQATVEASPAATSEASTPLAGFGVGRILYSSQDPVDGRYRIWAQPVTASVSPVFLAEDAMQPALRPDGQRLAFRSVRDDQRGLGSIDPGTDLRLRFTIFSEDVMPSWNPDGNRLVFSSTREGDRLSRIYTAWTDGNDNGSSVVFGEDPSWHPSDDRIVYRGCDERGNNCGLRLMNSGGGNPSSLTTVPGDTHPVWTPDGRSVLFMSQERHGNWEIYRIDTTTGAVIRLTNDPAIDGLPTVSPDGSRVAFLSNRSGAWQIWIKPITGGAEQPLAAIKGELPNFLEQKIQWVR